MPKLFKMNGFLKKTEEINTRGIGLGLHICRELVRRLGGDIICESKWQEGSTFTFVVKVELVDEGHELQNKFERIVNPNQKRIFPRINIQNEVAMRDDDNFEESESFDLSDFSKERPHCKSYPNLPHFIKSNHHIIGSKTAHDVKNKEVESSLSDGLKSRRSNDSPLYNQDSPESSEGEQAPISGPPQRRVLVVDDEPFNLLTIK